MIESPRSNEQSLAPNHAAFRQTWDEPTGFPGLMTCHSQADSGEWAQAHLAAPSGHGKAENPALCLGCRDLQVKTGAVGVDPLHALRHRALVVGRVGREPAATPVDGSDRLPLSGVSPPSRSEESAGFDISPDAHAHHGQELPLQLFRRS